MTTEPMKLPPYVTRTRSRHGKLCLYVRRRTGRWIRLKASPGTPEFISEYLAALKELGLPPDGEPREVDTPLSGTLRDLCQEYYRSPEFKRLSKSTRHVRQLILERLCKRTDQKGIETGDKGAGYIERRHVRMWRDEMSDRPEAANGMVKALRQVFKWAVDTERTEDNPARDVPYLSSNNPDGFHTWSVEEIQQFQERHPVGTKARLALDLFLYTGVRRSDAVRLGPQMERGNELHFTEAKGRSLKVKARVVPILPPLRQSIEATPSGHLSYLVTEFGKPFTSNGLGNWFRKRCNEAGLPHCSAHGLRKAGATIAAENGATEHQLMAIYGWESPKQAALYTRKADRKRLAGASMHLLMTDQNENSCVAPHIQGATRAEKKK
ncbi:tyrosine-type recombinase/integrase [Pelagibius marinus]|uniref:tyrosine-type recombinase/integrase n=1 Tax=Pelagibius marinus TaxID=2762760 RepID=UPI001872C38F|nr:tyrosine-type recombinase/integrase [Pelagibius marinus]